MEVPEPGFLFPDHLEPRRPGYSLIIAQRTGCWKEQAAPESFRQFQTLPRGLCPLGKPAPGAQRRRWLASQPAEGRAEAPWRRPRGRCRNQAAGALGASVPGCAGGHAREGRWPWEPDARAWCRGRRGQSRHCTLIFDLATGRCFAARCPPGLSASPSSGVSRSGARGDELLSAPPGSPALLLPPPLLLPPSLRQSSGGSRSKRPRPTAEGGGRAGTHRHAASGLGARGSLTCGRCRRRPAPGHLAKWATPSGWKSKSLVRPSERALGSGDRSSVPAPTRTGGPSAPGFLSLGWWWRGLSSTHPAPEGLTDPCATPRGRGTRGSSYWPSTPPPGPPWPALQPTVPPPGN